ncbi:MAG: hypothetical protein LBI45_02430, partial [Bacteroidales bacterium]|nr:hypothetical protein [Bacteroidales bacterium]
MVGAISTSSLLGVPTTSLIEGNYIKDNRYGITFTGGNINGTIKGNTLIDNNVETNPNNGGSGININNPAGNTHAIISENIISGHLWGITLVGNLTNYSNGPTANLGNISVSVTDPDYNIGKNIFSNNGNGGELYDLYNNNPKDIMAQNNNGGVPEQTEALIRTVIRDKVNDSRYGTVTFMPPYIIGGETCDPVTNLQVNYTSDCKAELTWKSTGISHKIMRDGLILAVGITSTSYTDYLGGSYPYPTHTWTVVSVCSNGESSEPVSVTKDVCQIQGDCNPPTNLEVNYSTDCSSAQLSWTAPTSSPAPSITIPTDKGERPP